MNNINTHSEVKRSNNQRVKRKSFEEEKQLHSRHYQLPATARKTCFYGFEGFEASVLLDFQDDLKAVLLLFLSSYVYLIKMNILDPLNVHLKISECKMNNKTYTSIQVS